MVDEDCLIDVNAVVELLEEENEPLDEFDDDGFDDPAHPQDLSCTFSGGIAELHAGMDSNRLSQRADEALYAAKHGGRNRIEVFQPSS